MLNTKWKEAAYILLKTMDWNSLFSNGKAVCGSFRCCHRMFRVLTVIFRKECSSHFRGIQMPADMETGL